MTHGTPSTMKRPSAPDELDETMTKLIGTDATPANSVIPSHMET
jgi:hypothetical protein